MELRYVDPRTLLPNPNNPRHGKPDPAYEAQLMANIAAVGLFQPPVVREIDGKLVIKAGDCRTRATIALKLETIPVLVLNDDPTVDTMRSVSENLVRKGLNTVDTWRAMQALAGDGWTDEAIATALASQPRIIRRLKLCGSILPAILDQMAKGDEPNEHQLRTIASAELNDQEQVWKKHKPKKGEPAAGWSDIARALTRTRFYARNAKFDDKLAEAYGIAWQEDLFEQGDQDNRYTTNCEGFLGAQHEHMAQHLPKKHIILTLDQYGAAKLPPKAERVYGDNPGKGTSTGHYVDDRTGEHKTIAYRMPDQAPKTMKGKGGSKSGDAGDTASTDQDTSEPETKTRAPVTKEGVQMIGDFQTEALHAALASVDLDANTLIGLLILALAGGNVDVRSALADGKFQYEGRKKIAASIIPNDVLTNDPATLHKAAREMLRYTLTLRERSYNAKSGHVALIAGDTVGADNFLPNMATQEFLSCLSKAEIERLGAASGVLPRQTGKATRAAVIDRFKGHSFIYDAARFVVPEGALAIKDYGWPARNDDDAPAADEGTDQNSDVAPDTEQADPADDPTDEIEPTDESVPRIAELAD